MRFNTLKAVLRLVSTAFLLIIVMSSLAQTPVDKPETSTERGVDWLWLQLENSLSGAAGGHPVLGRKALSVTFLVNTSQSNTLSAYAEFYKGVIRRFLIRLVEEEKKTAGDKAASTFSVYTGMQLGSLQSRRRLVTPLSGICPVRSPEITSLQLPSVTIPVLPDNTPYKGGHSHSTAREEAIRLLGPADAKRVQVIVMFTPIDTEEDTTDPIQDPSKRMRDGRTYGMPQADWVAYTASGLPLKGAQPLAGSAPQDVYIWLYGPAKITQALDYQPVKLDSPPASTARQIPVELIGEVLVGVLAIATLIILALRFLPREMDLQIAGQSIPIRPGQTVEIWGPNSERGDGQDRVLRTDDGPTIRPKNWLKLPSLGCMSCSVRLAEWS